MVLTCEVCGRPLDGAPSKVTMDGAVLSVCRRCAGRGKPYQPPPSPQRGFGLAPRPVRAIKEPELEVDPQCGPMVKQAREKLGLTQEQLGRAINVKASVVSHVESGKMKPDIALARTLARYLKVDLLVPSAELEP
ncbi:MAG: TIGR00270 family protein [Nitrososphaerota archaeon]|jgi:putative transcription factor|nr:multiprotein-bridging factor 1 family protein [Nitrososphaerota archaeon]MDG6962075.1 TIGR00270 family protein [Nitrososphaerota archaeon]MDG6962882.1 TIGR00270 family protein [Nitrososphaerota archaeon]MDG6973016.1 TIGR00270 family protein [Nitrososphaerota archaeon]MDG7003253.1 TIGR00270 family protein [Nitrososphaerota archaeon]